MAVKFTALSLNAVKRQILLPSKIKAVKPTMQQRTMFQIYTEAGGIGPKPEITRFGVVKIFALVIPTITIGGFMSREVASLLEEHDIFAPDEDGD